jgi:phosphatidate cytidylyltransferase
MAQSAPDLRVPVAVHNSRARYVSALLLAPIALLAVYWGGWPMIGVAAVCGLLAIAEWENLATTGGGSKWSRSWAAAAVVVAAIVADAIGLAAAVLWLMAVASLFLMVPATARKRAAWNAFGLIYIGLPVVSLVWLRGNDAEGLYTILWVLAVVWTTDICAFFIGRTVGGRKLAPSISPGKTWSGAFGGLAGAGAVGVVAALLAQGQIVGLLIASAAISVVAQAGDLFESAVKRRAGVKDSGTLVPGHGGVLDRLDSLLLALPVVTAAVLLGGGDLLPWRS